MQKYVIKVLAVISWESYGWIIIEDILVLIELEYI